MLQPPVLDRCRALGASAVYVEDDGSHLYNAAFGHPLSEMLNPEASVAFVLADRSKGTTAHNKCGSGDGTYGGSLGASPTDTTDSPSVNDPWPDPLTKSVDVSLNASVTASLTASSGLVSATNNPPAGSTPGFGIGFWFKIPATKTNATDFTALEFATTSGSNNVTLEVQIARTSSCHKPTVTIVTDNQTKTLEPDQDDAPHSTYGQDNPKEWHYLAVSVSTSIARLYIDGLESAVASGTYTFDGKTTGTFNINRKADGTNGCSSGGGMLYSSAVVYKTPPSAADISRIYQSYRRSMDIPSTGSGPFNTRPPVKPSDGPIARCDHGYHVLVDMKASSTAAGFRDSDWKTHQRRLWAGGPSMFLMHRLDYDPAKTSGLQGDNILFDFEAQGYGGWQICGGTHAPINNTTDTDGILFYKKDRGWAIEVTTKPAGGSAENRTFTRDDVYPASTSQDYESVMLGHEGDGAKSLSQIRAGSSYFATEAGSGTTARFAPLFTNESAGGTAMQPDSDDLSRYAVLAYFPDLLTASE
ncbi:MAG: LamG-like jellyroll fold domain-containing protein, partial [Planctomycetota bacterium]|nr:LamG-like jellyroll fold domain-containing protein [Planctomycetota bacterium]